MTADTDVKLLGLTEWVFRGLVQQHPSIASQDPPGDGRATTERRAGRDGLSSVSLNSPERSCGDAPPESFRPPAPTRRAGAGKTSPRGHAARRVAASGVGRGDVPGAGGWSPSPQTPFRPAPVPAETWSRAGRAGDLDASVQWVVEGWPQDVGGPSMRSARSPAPPTSSSWSSTSPGRPARWGDDVEVLSSRPDRMGRGPQRRARRSRGGIVVRLDGSVEPTGDVFGPLVAALAEPGWGLRPLRGRHRDLREFHEAPAGAGDCDAVEGYLHGVPSGGGGRPSGRSTSGSVGTAPPTSNGLSVSRTRSAGWGWYRFPSSARASGLVPRGPRSVPGPPKRNYYRFLDPWRDRWDLTLAGRPAATTTRRARRARSRMRGRADATGRASAGSAASGPVSPLGGRGCGGRRDAAGGCSRAAARLWSGMVSCRRRRLEVRRRRSFRRRGAGRRAGEQVAVLVQHRSACYGVPGSAGG